MILTNTILEGELATFLENIALKKTSSCKIPFYKGKDTQNKKQLPFRNNVTAIPVWIERGIRKQVGFGLNKIGHDLKSRNLDHRNTSLSSFACS